MTRTQETALAAGALTLGAALLGRGLRSARSVSFTNASVVITGGLAAWGFSSRDNSREKARD